MTATAHHDEPLPFQGLKVIDCASFIAAPVAATLLADMGADVIKVEPPDGDPHRDLFRRVGCLPDPALTDNNFIWDLNSRHKRSIVLDPADMIRNALSTIGPYWTIAIFGAKATVTRAELLEAGADQALADSLDEYATVRAAFLSRRKAQIWSGLPMPDDDEAPVEDAPLAPGATPQPKPVDAPKAPEPTQQP